MANKKPVDRIDKIIRGWLNKRWNKSDALYLSVRYSKISPPEGVATFSGVGYPFDVIFECKGAITEEESPFTYIKEPGD